MAVQTYWALCCHESLPPMLALEAGQCCKELIWLGADGSVWKWCSAVGAELLLKSKYLTSSLAKMSGQVNLKRGLLCSRKMDVL